ncbi:hypothetical protein HZB07_07175 [Candidatus Saganbacteria bacterium]|nr:hypothetical protein [Candidatus Saganbacteria bacterium]
MQKLKERYLTDKNGHKEAVVLDVGTYEELLENLEDLYVIAERKKEPTVSLETVKRSLKRSGLL